MDNNEENNMEATFEAQTMDISYRTQFINAIGEDGLLAKTNRFSIHEMRVTTTETMTLTELLDSMPTAIGRTGIAKGGVYEIQTKEGIINHRLGRRNLVTNRGANNKNVIFRTWKEMDDPNTPEFDAEWIDEGEVEIEYFTTNENYEAHKEGVDGLLARLEAHKELVNA